MLLLRRNWPPPLKMDEAAYRRYRLRLALLISVWAISAVAVIFYWSALPILARVVVIFVLILVTPDLSTIEQLFTSYEGYRKDGLW